MNNYTKRGTAFLSLFLLFSGGLAACSDDSPAGANQPVLELAAKTLDFDANGGEQIVAVNTNREDWTASVNPDGKEWCTAIPETVGQKHQLCISATSNTGRNARSTLVVINVEGTKDTLEVRQLGEERGILVSPQIMTVEASGGDVDFTVTTNIDFEIVTDAWIVEAPRTRSTEWVETRHRYKVQGNTGAARTGIILVKGLEDNEDISAEISVTQKAFGNYEAENSTLEGDILIPVAGGSAVNAKGQASVNGSSVFSRTFDGDKATGYHSSTSQDDFSNPEQAGNWPLTFTYEFEGQERIDYFVLYDDGNTNSMAQADIEVATEAHPEYRKVAECDFSGSLNPVRIVFSEPLIRPLGVRIVAKTPASRYVVIREVEFYRTNPDNFDPLTLFTDLTCSELKPGVSEADINDCPDPLFRNMALYMLMDKYPREFRIQDYRAYPHPDLWRQANKTSAAHDVLDNATGIYVEEGEELVVLVGETNGTPISLRVLNLDVPGDDGFNYTYMYALSPGINRIIPETKGLVYIYYHTPDYQSASPIRIHIPSGKVNGYFNSTIHQATDWERLLNAATAPYFDVFGERAHLIFPTESFRQYTPDGKELADAYDRLIRLEQELMGLIKYNRPDPNHVCFSVMYKSYMYSASTHTGYVYSTMPDLCNVQSLTTTDIWGPAHEVGHSHQTKPGLCWLGMTEVTNNIHSLYVQTAFGNKSRLLDSASGGKFTSIYEKAMSAFFVHTFPYILNEHGTDVFCQLVPLWQLHLYTKAMGNEDFYKDLHEEIRVNPDQDTPGASQLEFTVLASKAAGMDLTDFFTAWHFFEPLDEVITDYGEGRFIITETMAEDAKQRIAAMGLPKPLKLQYITDDNAGLFKTDKVIVKGSAVRDGRAFTMSGWQNVVAYEVCSEGKICFVSPAETFTVPDDVALDETVQVFGISASGERVEATLNE